MNEMKKPDTVSDETLSRLNAQLADLMAHEEAGGDDLDAQLLPLFLQEADELCDRIADSLTAGDSLSRLLHTLKGSARMTGVMRIGHLAHEMESCSPARAALLTEYLQQIYVILDELHTLPAALPPMEVNLKDRLAKLVLHTAKESGKQVHLNYSGIALPEKLLVPLEHLLRNAIVHGIEDEITRINSGKSAAGEIVLTVQHEGCELLVQLGDDGRGLDLQALRIQAVKRGLMKSDEWPAEDWLAQLIFIPGLSTVEQVSELAGRGVGMDVVKHEIAALGGQINVISSAGTGAQFTIRLPLSPVCRRQGNVE